MFFFPSRALSCTQTSTLYLSICFNHKYINIHMHTYVLYICFKLPLINWSHYSLFNAFNLNPTRDGGWGMNCNLSSWFMKNTELFEQKKKKKLIWWKIKHSLCSTCYRGHPEDGLLSQAETCWRTNQQ